MARAREELTAKAQSQGLDVAPGQLAAAGLVELPPEEQPKEAPPELKAGEGKYFRVTHVCGTIPAEHDQGRPDHVVRAADRANAFERFNHELGITGFDGQHVKREVQEASEAEYILAQAKRLRVDLREQRKKNVDKKHPEYGLLTWAPPGGVVGKYKVSDKGELSAIA